MASPGLGDLLEFVDAGGVIRFGGQRVLLLDVELIGALRAALAERFGPAAARELITELGYQQGRRTAAAIEHSLAWPDFDDWRRAGGRMLQLQGMASVEPVHESQRADPPALVEALWRDGFEVEQHLRMHGRSSEPVCWMSCGFASGYLSRVHEREIVCVETHCRAQGDEVCRMRGDVDPEGERGQIDAARTLATAAAKVVSEGRGAKRLRLGSFGPTMGAVVERARTLAPMGTALLITGPSGVGKQHLAEYIHSSSSRVGRPLVLARCGGGATGEQQGSADSELFGHVAGAFPGAHDRVGLVEAAHTGTLVLEEVAALSAAGQARLVELLRRRHCRRLGENDARPVDVRIVATSERDLEAEVEAGRFGAELYGLLRVGELSIPPLRERPEDLLPLAGVLLAEASQRLGRGLRGFSPSASERLLGYDWPGNVRELETAIERAVALARGEVVEVGDLPNLGARGSGLGGELRGGLGGAQSARELRGRAARDHANAHRRLEMSLAEVEREHVLAVLAAAGDNKAEAARRLRIGAATLFRKLKRYDEDDRTRDEG